MISFRVPSEELSSLLQSIIRVIPSQDPNRLRTEFLFEIREQKLRITGSNPQYRISSSIDLPEATSDWKFTVPPSDIVDYVKELPEQPLSFTYDPDEEVGRGPLTMTFEGGVIRFTGTNGENYPDFEKDEADETFAFAIGTHLIRKGINMVLPSVSPDASRKNLSGICFRFYTDHLDLVATDGIILSKYTIAKQFIPTLPASDKKTFILPAPCANFMKTFLPKYDGEEMQVSFSEKSILFRVGTVEIESLLIDARYPNYESIIPNNCEYKLTMSTPELKTVVKRMAKFINDDGIIMLEPSQLDLKIKVEKSEENKFAEETITLENSSSLDRPIYLDKKRLIITIDNIDTAQIMFKLLDTTRPILITPTECEPETELLNLISPLAPPSA